MKFLSNFAFAAALATGIATLLTAQPAAAKTVNGDCSITVNGKVKLNLKKVCRIEFIDGDGSFIVNGDQKGSKYFAYVTMLDDGFANVSWNGSPASTHAQDLLGEDFRKHGGCWVGRKGKVCAYKR